MTRLRKDKNRCGPVLLVSHLNGLRSIFSGRRPGAASRTLFARTSGRAIRIAASRPLLASVVDSRFTDGRMDALELALNLRDMTGGTPVWLVSNRNGVPPAAIAITRVSGRHGRRRPVTIPAMLRTMPGHFFKGGRS